MHIRRERELGLTELSVLTGGVGVPSNIAFFGGLFFFLLLVALRYVEELPRRQMRKEVSMKQRACKRVARWFGAVKSLASTVGAIGAGMFGTVALSGQAHARDNEAQDCVPVA